MIVAGIVIVGGSVYVLTQDKSAATTTEESGAADNQTPGKFSGTMMDLSKRGGSWQCSVDTSTAQAASSGTVYVSGNKVRADFTMNVQGYGTVSAYMIADGEFTYSWSSMMPQGVKAKMTTEGQGGTATSGQGVDASMSYGYDCQPWTPDASKFVVPTNVSFRTIEQ